MTPYRVFLLALVSAVLGFIAGVKWCIRTEKPRLDDLAARVDEALKPLKARFDLFKTPAGVPAEPTFRFTVDVLLRDGEAISVGAKGEARWNLIVCGQSSGVNPCGPDGTVPDQWGAVFNKAGISPTDARRPSPGAEGSG